MLLDQIKEARYNFELLWVHYCICSDVLSIKALILKHILHWSLIHFVNSSNEIKLPGLEFFYFFFSCGILVINWFVMSWDAMNSSISLLTKKCWTRIYGSLLTLTLIKISILWHKLSNYILRLSPGQKPLLRLFEEAKSDNFPINFASMFSICFGCFFNNWRFEKSHFVAW